MELPLGVLYIPFVIFVYASMTNAVNLTDGLDGLCFGNCRNSVCDAAYCDHYPVGT